MDIAGAVNRMRLQRMKMVQTMVGRVSNTFVFPFTDNVYNIHVLAYTGTICIYS